MVSENFRHLENKIANAQFLHDDLVGEIAQKLGKERDIIERVVYRACVTTGVIPTEAAFVVNEFLVFLHEMEQPKEQAS